MKVFWEHDVFASQTNSLWYKRASCVSPIIDVSASDPLAPLLQAAVLSGRGLASVKVFLDSDTKIFKVQTRSLVRKVK